MRAWVYGYVGMLPPGADLPWWAQVLGTLANLYIPEFNFEHLVQKHDLLNFISEFAQPGIVEDDILLEIVIFAGTLCNDRTAQEVVDSGLVTKLYHLMSEKKEDDEFVLQIAYTFHKLLMFEPTKAELLNGTSVSPQRAQQRPTRACLYISPSGGLLSCGDTHSVFQEFYAGRRT